MAALPSWAICGFEIERVLGEGELVVGGAEGLSVQGSPTLRLSCRDLNTIAAIEAASFLQHRSCGSSDDDSFVILVAMADFGIEHLSTPGISRAVHRIVKPLEYLIILAAQA